MKLLIAGAVLLFACRSHTDGPDRWAEVEKLAAPTVGAADGSLLTKALERVKDGDVPELALEDAIAWRKAGGGLPWRAGRNMEDPRMLNAFKLGEALLDRRGDSADAIVTVLYLAQRLRAEGPALIDVTIGFTLAGKVMAKVEAKPAYAPFAPTEAEARRAIPADALHFLRMMTQMPNDDQTIVKAVKKTYTEMLAGAPVDPAGYVKRIETVTAKAQKSEMLSIVISPRLPTLAKEIFETVDRYRAWMR